MAEELFPQEHMTALLFVAVEPHLITRTSWRYPCHLFPYLRFRHHWVGIFRHTLACIRACASAAAISRLLV